MPAVQHIIQVSHMEGMGIQAFGPSSAVAQDSHYQNAGLKAQEQDLNHEPRCITCGHHKWGLKCCTKYQLYFL